MQENFESSSDIREFLGNLGGDHQSAEVLLQSAGDSAKIYLEKGLIIWAFATGQKESFQSILLRENKFAKETLLHGIQEARTAGKKSLDDILQILGVESPIVRRGIIGRHTRAAFQIITNWASCRVQVNATQGSITGTIQGIPLEQLLDEVAEEQSNTPPTEKLSQTLAPAEESAAEPSAQAPANATEKEAEDQSAPSIKPPSLTSTSGTRTIVPQNKVIEFHSLRDVLEQFRKEIPAFVAAVIFDNETGMPLETIAGADNFDGDAVSAFYLDVIKSALEALGTRDQTQGLEEILISHSEDYVILRSLSEGAFHILLLIKTTSNPGLARVVVRRYSDKLESFLSV